MGQLKASGSRTEQSNKVMWCVFVTDHPIKMWSFSTWKKSSNCRLEDCWSTLRHFLRTGAGWLNWVCAVWDLLLENNEDPVRGMKFDGYSCPKLMEINILREVRKASSRIMTVDIKRGGLMELIGRIAQEAALGSRVVQERWWTSRGNLLKAPELQWSTRYLCFFHQGISPGDGSKLQAGKFRLGARKIPFHKEDAQVVEQAVQMVCKIDIFEEIEKFWTRHWRTWCNFNIFCALSVGLDSDSGIAFQYKLLSDLWSHTVGWLRQCLLKTKLLFVPLSFAPPRFDCSQRNFLIVLWKNCFFSEMKL